MTNFHLRKIFILLLGALLMGSALFAMGWLNSARMASVVAHPLDQTVESAQLAPPNVLLDADVLLTMTVGLTENTCAEKDATTVEANTLVFLCYRIGNIGTAPLISYTLTHSPPGLVDAGALTLEPGSETTRILGATFNNTTALTATLVAAATISDTTVNVTTTDSVRVTVLRPSVTLGYNLSVTPEQCGVPTLSFASGATLYHCIVIRNVGPVALTQQTLSVPALGIISTTLNFNLSPGQVITITENNRQNLAFPLVQQGVLAGFSSVATLEVRTEKNDATSTTATATGISGQVRTAMTVNAGNDANSCATTPTVVMLSGSIVYFCVRINNTGTTTITEHSLTVPELGIDVSLQAILAPGQTLTLTSKLLAGTIAVPGLGPYTLTQSLAPIFVYKPGKDQETGSGESIPVSVAVATPTPSRTITPTATSTAIPLPSDTPIFTPSPTDTPLATIPPTPSETPSLTPSPITPPPTPTRSFAVSVLATPSPILPTPDAVATNNAIITEQAVAAAQGATAQADQLATAFAIQTEQIVAATNAAIALLTPALVETPFIDPNAPPTIDPALAGSAPVPVEAPTPIVATESAPALPLAEVAPESGLISTTVVITITATADPVLRPIASIAPPPPSDLLSVFGQAVERVLVVASWIWFLLAGLIFLIVTAIFFVLTLRRGAEDPFDLYAAEDDELDETARQPSRRFTASPTAKTSPTVKTSGRRRPTSNDPWPDSLP